MHLKHTLAAVVAAVFCLALANPVFSADAQQVIKVKKLSGTIQIVLPSKKVITVSNLKKMPAIPIGSTIRVIKGSALIVAGECSLTLKENQAAVLDQNPATGKMEIAATNDSAGSIVVRSGAGSATLTKGEKVETASINPPAQTVQGEPEIIPEPQQPIVPEASPSIP